MAIHPAQIAVIDRYLGVIDERRVWAWREMAGFVENPEAGTLALDDQTIGRLHLALARRRSGAGLLNPWPMRPSSRQHWFG